MLTHIYICVLQGAQKRFGKMFQNLTQGRLIVCGKKRVGDTRKVFIQDGDCEGKRILIVDDIVKTGGTLAECAKTLKKAGAKAICAYCTCRSNSGLLTRREASDTRTDLHTHTHTCTTFTQLRYPCRISWGQRETLL